MNQNEYAKEIAETILAQIRALDPWYLMAVGARNFVCINKPSESLYGLLFRVNGTKHKGIASIEYRPVPDLYDIVLYNQQNKEKRRVERIYFDQLIEQLEETVGE